MFFSRKFSVRRKKVRRTKPTATHYLAHKEQARELIHARLNYYNQQYKFVWNRVAIKNQRRCWGSCSSLKNLNFNYKIILLPAHLQDYIVVHELCHLAELNHGNEFWRLVERAVPDYQMCVAQLREIDRGGSSIGHLERVQELFSSPNDQGVTLTENHAGCQASV